MQQLILFHILPKKQHSPKTADSKHLFTIPLKQMDADQKDRHPNKEKGDVSNI